MSDIGVACNSRMNEIRPLRQVQLLPELITGNLALN